MLASFKYHCIQSTKKNFPDNWLKEIKEKQKQLENSDHGEEILKYHKIQDKIEAGFKCIKMKIGAIDFHTELNLLQSIRKNFSKKDIELRVDANGAFLPKDALEKLKRLSDLELHSIEQPIKQGQIEDMAKMLLEKLFM